MQKFTRKKYNGGAAMLVAVIFFLFASATIVLGITEPILKQARIATDLVRSKESYFIAESALEDVFYRLSNNKQVSSSETLNMDAGTVTSSVTNTTNGKQIIATANVNNKIRRMRADVILGVGASFNYGVQSGQGGFVLENSATLTGNIYSNGSIIGAGNTIHGDVVSAGVSGLINNIHATGTAYAHTIQNSDIDADAYYVVKTSTAVGGTSYPNSPDQPLSGMPISDEHISELEADALAGGVLSSPCPYKISSNRTLGPVKITCSLEITGSPTITLGGPVWVTGNITIQNSAILRVSSDLGNSSAAIIADNPNNRTTSSQIDLKNSSQFFGSGLPGSFIFLVSQNNSAELGGGEDAISMDNSSSGSVILYAPHGLINIQNSAVLKEVTGYKIKAKNSANIIYDTGLMSTLFTSGPGGGYEVIEWKEIQ